MFIMVTEVEEEPGKSGKITRAIQDPKITKDQVQDPIIKDPDHIQDYGDQNLGQLIGDFN